MLTIPINRYKPYEYIQLSREVVIDSILPTKRIASRNMKSHSKYAPITKLIQPVLVFGEMEWLMHKIVQQEGV